MKYCRKTGKAVSLMMIFWLVLTIGQAALAADGETSAYYKLTEVQRGTVDGSAKVNVRKKPDAGADRLGRLHPDESCVITGEEGDWWQVDFEGRTGYVLKDLLTVSFSLEDEEVWIDEPMDVSIAELEAPRILQYRNDYELRGTLRSNIPLLSVSVEIYDERIMKTERSCETTFRREDKVRSYPLENLEDDLSFHKLAPGEKTLIVRAAGQSESIVVAEIPFYVYGEVYEDENGISITPYSDPVSMTEDCRIEVAHGKFEKMTDYNFRTEWGFESPDDYITIKLPDERTAELLTIQWSVVPGQAMIELLGADQQVLSVIEENGADEMINSAYPLDEATRGIRISCADEGMTILELRVYEKDHVPQMTQQWEPLSEKTDLMVISTHQDDEMLFFGGTIPYYAGEQDKDVAVVYMAKCSRRRYSEALEGLWSCGLREHPIFLDLRDARLESYQETVDLWGEEATINMLVDLFRQYKPEVVVTHDVNGEYGHPQHILTTACVREAVRLAGDPTVSPDSAQLYGVWTPKKLYIHLYQENDLFMSVYDEPMEHHGNMNMTDIATIGFTKHVSQDEFFSMDNQGVKYDNRKYGLAFTTVGEDVEKNDFFENID